MKKRYKVTETQNGPCIVDTFKSKRMGIADVEKRLNETQNTLEEASVYLNTNKQTYIASTSIFHRIFCELSEVHCEDNL